MSFIPSGGSNVFIGNGVTQPWIITWNSSGWQGNSMIQPQPLNTGASMIYSDPSVSLNSNGTYAFSFTFTNNGPNSTQYNFQVSSS